MEGNERRSSFEDEVARLRQRLRESEDEADALSIAAARAGPLEIEVAALKREITELTSRNAALSNENKRLSDALAAAADGSIAAALVMTDPAEDEDFGLPFIIPGTLAPYETSYVKERCHAGMNVLCARIHPAHSDLIASGGVDMTVQFSTFAPDDARYASSSVRLPAPVLSMDFRPTSGGGLLAGCMDGSSHLLSWGRLGNAIAAYGSTGAEDENDDDYGGDGGGSEGEPRIVASFKDHAKYVVCNRWSADGQLFATASHDQTVALYRLAPFGAGSAGGGDAGSGSGGESGGGLNSGIRDGSFAGSGAEAGEETAAAAAAAGWEQVTKLYLPGAAECLEFVDGDGGAPTLVVSCRGLPHLTYVDCETLQQAKVSINDNAWDSHVSFSILGLTRSPADGGRYLLAATDKSRHLLFRVGHSRHVRTLHAPLADGYFQPRCVFDASGRFAVGNAQQDNALHVFCLASQREVAVLLGHSGAVRDVHGDAASRRIVTASYDKSVRVWSASAAGAAVPSAR